MYTYIVYLSVINLDFLLDTIVDYMFMVIICQVIKLYNR